MGLQLNSVDNTDTMQQSLLEMQPQNQAKLWVVLLKDHNPISWKITLTTGIFCFYFCDIHKK